MRYRFADCELDTDRMELTRGEQPVHLEPQVLNILAYLIQQRNRVVTRDELHQAVWGRKVVTDNALSVRINTLRKALGDDGRRQAVVRTMPRLGYRFEASIELPGTAAPVERAAGGFSGNTESLLPSIVILPFRNLNGRQGNAFAQGLTHDLTTRVARSRRIIVIARSIAFEWGGEADVLEVGRALGVRYVCSGWLQSSGSRVRINVALSRSENREEIWSQCPDHLVRDLILVDSRVTEAIVAAIEGEIGRAEKLGTGGFDGRVTRQHHLP
jgi:DNA-binding winged helix-turn-helix (wHTH) protein